MNSPWGIRIIVEETVQKVYELDPHNRAHEDYYKFIGLALNGQAPADPVLGKRAKNGAEVEPPPHGLSPVTERTVLTKLTTLETENGVPRFEIVRTQTTIQQKPVKA